MGRDLHEGDVYDRKLRVMVIIDITAEHIGDDKFGKVNVANDSV